jgi:hypothetical protein
VADLSDGGGDFSVAGLSAESERKVAECGHDLGLCCDLDSGCVFMGSEVPGSVDSVLYRLMPPRVVGEVFGCGFAGGKVGDPEDGDRGADGDLLVYAVALGAFAHGAGGVALEEKHLGGAYQAFLFNDPHLARRQLLGDELSMGAHPDTTSPGQFRHHQTTADLEKLSWNLSTVRKAEDRR